ncbi:unnamed protein product, partial [Effrenium voratum]
SYCMQVVDQLCHEFEREVGQMTQDIVRYRGELARCADLLAFQLGKEKQYHSMLENIAGNTTNLVGKAAEVGQKHTANEGVKIQMHQLLEQMFEGGKGAYVEGFGGLDEHRQIAETHLQTSAELQNQSLAVQKELDNILNALQVPPVSYSQAPVIMGPQTSAFRPAAAPAAAAYGHGSHGLPGMIQAPSGMQMPGMVSPTKNFSLRSNPNSPVFTPSGGTSTPVTPNRFGKVGHLA